MLCTSQPKQWNKLICCRVMWPLGGIAEGNISPNIVTKISIIQKHLLHFFARHMHAIVMQHRVGEPQVSPFGTNVQGMRTLTLQLVPGSVSLWLASFLNFAQAISLRDFKCCVIPAADRHAWHWLEHSLPTCWSSLRRRFKGHFEHVCGNVGKVVFEEKKMLPF